MFFLLYKHTDDGVFDDFPKISDHFPKISEDAPKLLRRPDERSRTFSENFQEFPKMSEDCRGLSRETEDVSMIHQRIQVQFKRQTWYHRNHRYLHMWRYHIFICEDIVSFLSICYHSLYHWLLYNKLKYCPRCTGFELGLRTKNSRSQIFFNESYRPKVELNRDIAISLGGTWPLEIFDLTLVCSAILHGVVNNLHWLAGNQSNYMKLPYITYERYILNHVQPQCN